MQNVKSKTSVKCHYEETSTFARFEISQIYLCPDSTVVENLPHNPIIKGSNTALT